jgi:peroxiredoxin
MPFRSGLRAPPVTLARLERGEIVHHPAERLFQGRRAIVIGVPGAFTPVCTHEHIPAFVASAPRLRAAGFDLIACICPNDPWTTAAWANALDPDGKIMFLSDGNLDWARALKVSFFDKENFLGERSRRYRMTLRHAVIEKLVVEDSPLALTCTGVEDVLEVA